MRNVMDFALSLLYPPRCAFCGEVVPIGRKVCGGCEESLPYIRGERCPSCGDAVALCVCGQRSRFFSGIASPFYYEDPARGAVWRIKFRGERESAPVLASYLAQAVSEVFSGREFDLVIPVPVYEGDGRKYNHAELISSPLSKELDVAHSPSSLVKTRATGQQHTLTVAGRAENLAGAFEADEKTVVGKRILLVDDVFTTGSTMDECAKTLIFSGASEVFAAAVTISSLNLG